MRLGVPPSEVIRNKREGLALSTDDIRSFVAAVTDGRASDAQVGAFAMAVYLNGMSDPECVALTSAMAGSGTVLDWSDTELDGPRLDKHSTGGVGDKVSLILAPLLAACGAYVPMISGRGLGHTGGTLDKLEAIPGYCVDVDVDRFKATVKCAGAAIVGATPTIAPADRRLYAIRDVTATVESLPLITASILSKKLAANLDALVMDVKVGNGAFAPDLESANALANSVVTTANRAGLSTSALITDMNQIVGYAAGNALEVREVIDLLRADRVEPRLWLLVSALACEVLVAGGVVGDYTSAAALVERRLASGEAAERFSRMVAALGGPSDLLDGAARYLSRAPCVLPVGAEREGYVTTMDTRQIAMAIVKLGGGRQHPNDRVDHRVGVDGVIALGGRVERGDAMAVVHAADMDSARFAAKVIQQAVTVRDTQPPAAPIVLAHCRA